MFHCVRNSFANRSQQSHPLLVRRDGGSNVVRVRLPARKT